MQRRDLLKLIFVSPKLMSSEIAGAASELEPPGQLQINYELEMAKLPYRMARTQSKPESAIAKKDRALVAASSKCICGNNLAEKPHSCPYSAQINDDNNPEYCTCCQDCHQKCRDNI